MSILAADKKGEPRKIIAQNREARHEYFVIETLETGIELVGTEVKSLRNGGCNLKDSWVDVDDGELIVKGMHISPYEMGNIFNREPRRPRRLLAHKGEIRRLAQQIKLRCRFTSSTAASSWSWGCARAKSSMTSGPAPRRGTPSATLTAR